MPPSCIGIGPASGQIPPSIIGLGSRGTAFRRPETGRPGTPSGGRPVYHPAVGHPPAATQGPAHARFARARQSGCAELVVMSRSGVGKCGPVHGLRRTHSRPGAPRTRYYLQSPVSSASYRARPGITERTRLPADELELVGIRPLRPSHQGQRTGSAHSHWKRRSAVASTRPATNR